MLNTRKPYYWVPTVYMLQGIPFGLVMVIVPLFYKNLGWSNSFIALFTSLLTIPWTLKFFLAPALENLATRRTLTLLSQFAIALLTAFISFLLFEPSWVNLSLILFGLIACFAAIHDINSDGLYLELDKQIQTYFIGIRSLFYQLGKFISQGVMIFLAGYFIAHFKQKLGWQFAFLSLFFIIIFCIFLNYKTIPKIKTNTPSMSWSVYKEVFKEFKLLPYLTCSIFFIFFYNFSEYQIMKIFPLFLLDKKELGGLAYSLAQISFLTGLITFFGMLSGIILSGLILKYYGLKKVLLPLTFMTGLVNVSYWLIAYHVVVSWWPIVCCILLAQLFFGLSNGAYMLFLVNYFSQGRKYSMSLYAIGTVIMLFGMMIAGSISGYLQIKLGYAGFFAWILVVNLFIVVLTAYLVRKNYEFL